MSQPTNEQKILNNWYLHAAQLPGSVSTLLELLRKKKLTTEEEQRELLDLYISLVENTPPMGEMGSWHRLAGGAALAAAKIVVGRDGAIVELKEATNCKACHDSHKPPEN